MLVITQEAEIKARQMLRNLAAEPSGWRCLYLKPASEQPLSSGQIRALTETFQTYLQDMTGSVFFSDLGHVWGIYKNELTPTQTFQLLNRLRAQYTDAAHAAEHIYMADLKTQLAEVMARLEPLCMPKPIKPTLPKNNGNSSDAMAAFFQDVPADTSRQIAQQRGRRRETVILTVEDDPFYSRLIEKVFSNQARVVVAHQPDQVLEEYVISAPDIVLLDIGLPEVSGHQLLKSLLRLDPEAYIVMASGNSARGDVTAAINAGAKGFITKPFSREKLMRAVNLAPTIKQHLT